MKLFTPKFALTAALVCWLWVLLLAGQSNPSAASGSPAHGSQSTDVKDLERDFFAAIRSGDTGKFMSYVSSGGVNVGPKAEHMSWEEVNEQMNQQGGLYCKLFDSSCIQSEIHLDNSNVRDCSYRELLTQTKKVRTASTETTRNGVRQAVLVAEIKNEHCAGVGLIDFIFNLQADGWKLFSIP